MTSLKVKRERRAGEGMTRGSGLPKEVKRSRLKCVVGARPAGREQRGQAVGAEPALDLHMRRPGESAGLGPGYSSCCFKCFAFEL